VQIVYHISGRGINMTRAVKEYLET